jgi:multimeric flavodoxin WrbA/putative sterol carrier protein
MKRLHSILPPIILTVYATVGNMSHFSLSVMRPLSVFALVLMLLVLHRKRKADGLSAIENGFALYTAFSVAAFWGFPQSLARVAATFPTGTLYAFLCGTVALPAFFAKRYFTVYFAKKSTPEAVWGTSVFGAINRNMTWAWAVIFAVSAGITAIPYLLSMPESTFANIVFQLILPGALMLGVGVALNRRYPEYYQRKMGIEPMQSTGTVTMPESSVETEKPYVEEENMSDQLKVVAINGSPHGAIGNTSQMIRMIGEALSVHGIVLEEIILADKKIEYCIGCAVCLEKSRCWRQDDHARITDKLLAADGAILASPVYFKHVTAQMKTFIDRSLGLGHKPRGAWKPGLAVSVSAGMAETSTAHYLAGVLGAYGAFSVGTLTAIATGPGGFLGKDLVEARAKDLARDLSVAIKEKRRYPATDENLFFYLFMRDLVTREKDFMRDDYAHWQNQGFMEGFLAYIQQQFAVSPYDPALRKEWLKGMMKEEKAKTKGEAAGQDAAPAHAGGPTSARTCLELLKMMPLGFKSEAATGLSAVYQFVITGAEEFTAHLKIADGRCTYHDGPSDKPDVTIKSPAEVWLAISRGEMDGQSAFMSGKYTVEGDLTLLLKLKSLFG